MTDMRHMGYLEAVAAGDVAVLREKEATYQGSWKRRGGVGAFMMLARKWDRLEMICGSTYDIFSIIGGQCDAERAMKNPPGSDGTALAEVRDLRRYLLLVEAEMAARGVIAGYERRRPTVEELDKMLNSEDDMPVEVQPDGSVKVMGTPEDGGDYDAGVPSGYERKTEPRDGWTTPPPWPYIVTVDPLTSRRVYNVDRRVEGAPQMALRLQTDMNNKELELSDPRYRGMYKWTDQGEGKWQLRPEYRDHWGRS